MAETIKIETPEELGKLLGEQQDKIDGLVSQVGELESTIGQLTETCKKAVSFSRPCGPTITKRSSKLAAHRSSPARLVR